ncbi:hypothetical protein EMPS_04899 [Entomortierella parvispora]|uniref:Ndc10 domain-containing protein n=1 Tax=Entomortierella parvispora TaxID=205924 RepID=A0A9P3H9G6_9FUNG|nr:hypothetical protein EMPS_04899 [Entomortierella parvispora]
MATRMSPLASSCGPLPVPISASQTTQQRTTTDNIDQNPPPAYGEFAFHLAGGTRASQASRPSSILSESSPSSVRDSASTSSLGGRGPPAAPINPLPPLTPVLAPASAPQMPPSSSSQLSQSEQFLLEIDQDLTKVNSLLSEISTLTSEQASVLSSAITPAATFRELNAMELYHQRPQKCLSGLAKERQRLLKARQTMRVQWINVQAQADRQRESRTTATAAIAASGSHPPNHSSEAHNDDSGPLSSASVALTVALHEASTERLAEIKLLDNAITETRNTIRSLNVRYQDNGVPKDLLSTKTNYHLYQFDRSKVVKALHEELETYRNYRLELLKTHQKLHVQGLVAQMQCLAGVVSSNGSSMSTSIEQGFGSSSGSAVTSEPLLTESSAVGGPISVKGGRGRPRKSAIVGSGTGTTRGVVGNRNGKHKADTYTDTVDISNSSHFDLRTNLTTNNANSTNDTNDASNNNNNIILNANSSNHTDFYSVLGADRVEPFYVEGSLYGYEDGIRAGSPPRDETATTDPLDETGPRELNESNYPLNFFYERYFEQFPMDDTTLDTSSSYSSSAEDDSENDNSAIISPESDRVQRLKRKIRKDQHTSLRCAPRSRLSLRTTVSRLHVDDTGDTEDEDEHGIDVQLLGDNQGRLMTDSGTPKRWAGEAYDDYVERVRWDQEFYVKLEQHLQKVRVSEPARAKLTELETHVIRLEHEATRAVKMTAELRIQQHAPGTRAAYDQFHRHWRRWCKRKKYRLPGTKKVDFRVFHNKFILYMREGTHMEGYDGDGDRAAAILPFFATSRIQVSETITGRRSKAVMRKIRILPSVSTLRQYVNGVNDLRTTQGTTGVLDITRDPDLRSGALSAIIGAFKTRVAGDPRTDSKKYTTINHADGNELIKLRDLMRAAWVNRYLKQGEKPSRNLPQKLTSLRERLLISWKHIMMMGEENIRFAKLPHINIHSFANRTGSSTGPRPSTFAIVLLMTQGKGGCTYGVTVRNTEVNLCPIGSLAFYLFYLWSEVGEPPEFMEDDWHEDYLVHGAGKKTTQLSPSAHLDGMARLFKATGIVTNQPTHYFRGLGLNHVRDASATIADIQQHGGWFRDQSRFTTHYLHPLPKGVAFAMAGSVQPDYYIGPYHSDWLHWIRNIMEGKNEFEGRSTTTRMPIPDESDRSGVLRLKFLILLVHLRKILLQDAAALQATQDDNARYSEHHIFQLPVFKSTEFAVFKQQLVANMSTLAPPQSDSLRQNAPAFEAEFRLSNSTIATGLDQLKIQIDRTMEDCTKSFQEMLHKTETNIPNTIKNVSALHTADLAATFSNEQEIRAQAVLDVLGSLLSQVPDLIRERIMALKQVSGSTTGSVTSMRNIQVDLRHLRPPPTSSTTAGTGVDLDQRGDLGLDEDSPDVMAPGETHRNSPERQENLPTLSPEIQSTLPSTQRTFISTQHHPPVHSSAQGTQASDQPSLPTQSSTQGTPLVSTHLPAPSTQPAPAAIRPQLQVTPCSIVPQKLEEQLDILAAEVAGSRSVLEVDVSEGFTYEMIPRGRPLADHWEEWFYVILPIRPGDMSIIPNHPIPTTFYGHIRKVSCVGF